MAWKSFLWPKNSWEVYNPTSPNSYKSIIWFSPKKNHFFPHEKNKKTIFHFSLINYRSTIISFQIKMIKGLALPPPTRLPSLYAASAHRLFSLPPRPCRLVCSALSPIPALNPSDSPTPMEPSADGAVAAGSKLEDLNWDHSFVRELPGDSRSESIPRQVYYYYLKSVCNGWVSIWCNVMYVSTMLFLLLDMLVV